ncbi:MAG TPA: DNA polymerase III subunit gamma/tau, partial [Stenomitos sp.]
MSNYLALYRKWRPKNFDDLVGQEHVARTLSNAITGHKLAHAYLFTGPRGTGKTSTARIFAKSLNCAQGPTIHPCEQCPACEGINRGNFPDVIEIDAASNRGVDDARDLRDRVRFAPTHGRYKVFIIDEVHMLTNEAFNALLKTIEEPPPNLVFVLATTDVHKVLPTIISRCQRFDFQRIPFADLVARLRFVTEQEGFTVDQTGLEAIAKRADGGLRDALSLLDQVRSCASSETISAQDVFEALGIVSNEAVVGIVRAIADNQVVPAIEGLQALLAAGFDHNAVIRELLEFCRHLLLVGVAGDRAQALEIPPAQWQPLQELATRLATPEVLYAMEVLRETETLLKGSNQMTVWLEMALIRLCQRQDIPSITDLMRRVSALEEKMANVGSLPTGAQRPARPAYAAPPSPAPAATPAPAAQAAVPVPSVPSPVASAAIPAATAQPAAAPLPEASVEGGDDLVTLLAALSRVHRSTHSLLEQHGIYAR